MGAAFWEGFEKKAILSMIAKPLLSAAATVGKKVATNPMKSGGLLLGGLESAHAMAAGSGTVANSRRLNQAMGLMRSSGRTF